MCFNARGGVFNHSQSNSWQPLGPWQLGLGDLPFGGNGDYGLDQITFTDTISQVTTSVGNALVAGINDTHYYQGYIGLGVNQGRFGENTTNPLMIQLAETYGLIPSHSYGYTAGANYADKMPASLTLGGYDKLRFKPHDVNFNLDANTRTPSVRLRGVTATVLDLQSAPTSNWISTSQPLLSMNDSIKAIIDTSTPYLWLPQSVCDRFAAKLSLQWNETLGVYVFSEGSQYTDYLQRDDLNFTFSVSSYDYLDDFADPLALPGVVNITVPAAAFAQLLRYPFNNVIQFTDSSIPYFPLKRAVEGKPYILGRAFMQAAYMIMNYETGSFSLHEALFPENPATNREIVTIEHAPTSPYPGYVPPPPESTGLRTPQIVGIAVAAALGGSIALIVWWCWYRRRKTRTSNPRSSTTLEEMKEETASVESDLPRSPVRRMMSAIIGRRRGAKKPAVHEVHGNETQPVEFAADASHEVYELPVPLEPVELDSNDGGTNETTEFGTDHSHGLSPYEIARRKLDRQLQGPVPVYMPPEGEKTCYDVSPVAHYRPSDEPSPASSPTYANSNSLPRSLPSPLSPHPAEWTNRHFDLPSPMTVAPPFPSPQFPGNNPSPSSSPLSPTSPRSLHSLQTRIPPFERSVITHSSSSNVSPVTPVSGSVIPPSPSYQRTPIDPSRVICLGPLPENVQLPRLQPSLPRLVTPDGRMIEPGPHSNSPGPSPLSPLSGASGHRRRSTSTLGSNFTEEEVDRIKEATRHGSSSSRQPPHVQSEGEQDTDEIPRSPASMIDPGSELIHVPQLAEKRYSWENTR